MKVILGIHDLGHISSFHLLHFFKSTITIETISWSLLCYLCSSCRSSKQGKRFTTGIGLKTFKATVTYINTIWSLGIMLLKLVFMSRFLWVLQTLHGILCNWSNRCDYVYVTVQDRFGKHLGFCANMLAFHSFSHVKQVSHGCRGMSTEGGKVHKGYRIPLPSVSIFMHLHVSPTISTNFMVQGEIVLQNSPTKGDWWEKWNGFDDNKNYVSEGAWNNTPIRGGWMTQWKSLPDNNVSSLCKKG